MNEHPPLTPELIDELLSAELDGDFDAAARDLGFDPAAAADALQDLPGVDDRRAALAEARDALRTVPALDELTATRLRAAAISELGATSKVAPPRHTPWAAIVGIAAAAVLVFGVVGVAARSTSNDSKSSQTESASRGVPTSSSVVDGGIQAAPSAPSTVDFGSLKSLSDVDARVHESLSFNVGNATAAGANDQFGAPKQDATVPASLTTCDVKARAAADVASSPVVLGTAQLSSRPVTIFVYDRNGSFVAVASDPSCNVVARRVVR